MTTRTRPQHLKALAEANRVRFGRAELKREIAAGHITVEEVLMSTPDVAWTMSLAELIQAQHRWGAARTRRLLNDLNISWTRQLAYLTDRQRRVVAEALER